MTGPVASGRPCLVPRSNPDPLGRLLVGAQGLLLSNIPETFAGREAEVLSVAQTNSAVRVVLIGCTGLLGDIIRRTVIDEPELDVVAHLPTPGPDVNLSQFDADIILWNNAEEDRIVRWLTGLTQYRAPRVLATFTDGQQAALWELTPHRIELGALSPDTLVETIRRRPRASVMNTSARPEAAD